MSVSPLRQHLRWIGSALLGLALLSACALPVAEVQTTPVESPHVLPTSAVHLGENGELWHPQIAYQYYGTEGAPSADVMARQLNWLMMRHGSEDMSRQVRELGYTHPIFQYVKAFQIQGPGPYKNENDRCRNDYTPISSNVMWTGDFCDKVHSHESWFLHNGKGERIYNKERNWDGSTVYEYYMNPASKGFRAFWTAQIKRQKSDEWQGFFLDNVAVSYEYLRTRGDNQDGVVKEYSSNDEWQAGINTLLDSLHSDFPDMAFWGNMIEAPYSGAAWEPFFEHLDGFQEENFATNWVDQRPLDPDQWNAMLQRTESALAHGKQVLLYGQGTRDDIERMRFSLASYLLVATADGRANFRYAYTSQYAELWWYPEYNLSLGTPTGPRYLDGTVWARDFQCGRVTVDPLQHTGTIEQRACS